jgi:hypothetical protein
MAPAGMFCAAGLALLAWMGNATTVDLLAPCFRIIAALTLPHMIVTAWLDRGVERRKRVQAGSKLLERREAYPVGRARAVRLGHRQMRRRG